MVGIGFLLRQRQGVKPVAWAVLAASVLFFLLTNLGVWAVSGLYPKTLQGLMACYTAAIPFFRSTLIGNIFYSTLLFGCFALAEKRFAALKEPALLKT